MIGQMANAWSVMFELQREGIMPENPWAVARRDLISILSSDGGMKFWRLLRSSVVIGDGSRLSSTSA